MKIKFKFGIGEPSKTANWWGGHITSFHKLIIYKGKKYEFVMYDSDDTKQVDYICAFSPLHSYDPAWHADTFQDIDSMFDDVWGNCECGAAYTSFPNHHMFFCKKWSKQ